MPKADPPSSSGTKKPVQPSSAIWRQRSREKPVGSRSSRSLRSAVTGLRSRKKSNAVSRTMRASSERMSGIRILFV